MDKKNDIKNDTSEKISCKNRCGKMKIPEDEHKSSSEDSEDSIRKKTTPGVSEAQVPVAAPSKLLRQIGEDHWKQGEDIMEGKPESKRKPLVVSMKSKCDVDGPDRQLYYVLFPRKDAQENWVRATGYPPDCRDWEHQLLTVEEWGEVSSVFDER
jgi:hypothetical protein